MLKNKRILITQPLICGFNGSTLVTLELATELQRMGAKVTIYTCAYADPAKKHFEKQQIKVDVANDNPSYKLSDFDYVWVHSQIIPISLLRELANGTPAKMPVFIFLHMSGMDWIPDEKPWIYDLENRLSSLSVFISEEVYDVNKPFLRQDIPVDFFRNPTPIDYKQRQSKPSASLENLLIVSNHPPAEVLEARKILTERYGIKVSVLGENQDSYTLFNKSILDKYDAVLTIAKTVPYCLVHGTPVYVYDVYGGGPGWLNEENFEQAKMRNFSGYQNSQYPDYEGGVFHYKTAEEIAAQVAEGYSKSLTFHAAHREQFYDDFAIDCVLPRIFKKAEPRKVTTLPKDYIDVVIEAERFATIKFEITTLLQIRDSHIRNLDERIKQLNREKAELEKFKRKAEKVFESRAYRSFDKLITPYKKIRGRG